ncbi:CLK4-associating serine/arginine rich protein isoform X2 [Photinus pyralis]|nr:CLK4-associating serine/arginine rich protein isoform X2 [Photinus pyralis]
MEEQFGYTEPESKKKKSSGVAIGFNYEDATAYPTQSSTGNAEENSDDNSDSDLDVDLYINVSKVDQFQAHEMNKHGLNFGMSSNDFYSFLTDDMEEAESNRLAREEEHEKALFSGRKSRRERRAHREKRLANRVISPPSYAARSSPTYPTFRESKSASRSPTPDNTGKITYITSFGDDDDIPTTSKPSYADKLKHGKKGKKRESSRDRTFAADKRRRSLSNDRDRNYRRRRKSRSIESRSPRFRRNSRSRKRTTSRERYRRRSHSRSRDHGRRYKPRRSSTSSSSNNSHKSRSRSRTTYRSTSRNRYPVRAKSSSSSSVASPNHSLVTRRFNKSRSSSIKKESPPKTTVQRYYGRKRSDQSSSSELEDLSDLENGNSKLGNSPNALETKATSYGNAVSAFKKSSSSVPIVASTTLNLQEKLKRKRQALLNKQFKADKLAEQLKTEREKQEQQNREDELREMAIKLRRRQREIRHAYDSHSSDSSCDSDDRNSTSSINRIMKSRSGSPKEANEERASKYRESSSKDKERVKDRKETDYQSATKSCSPKPYIECEKRMYYNDDKDRDMKRRSDYKKDRDSRSDYYKDRTSRSLVDY